MRERSLLVAVILMVVAVAATAFVVISYPPSSTTNESSSSAGSSLSAANSTSSSSLLSTLASSQSNTSAASEITVVTARLIAGSATNATFQGTASIQVVLSNGGPETAITSISIVRVPAVVRPQIFQCSSSASCSPISSPVVGGNTDTNFTSATRAFFVGAAVSAGVPYGYVIYFANGASIGGTLDATAGP